MKLSKSVVKMSALFLVLFFALATVTPVLGQFQKPPEPGNQNMYWWVVTCNYNANGELVSYSCSSNGHHQCAC